MVYKSILVMDYLIRFLLSSIIKSTHLSIMSEVRNASSLNFSLSSGFIECKSASL